ncbi:MAG: hypothetical protein ACTSXE_04080 [Candidatus Thorarchaeota archaeon]
MVGTQGDSARAELPLMWGHLRNIVDFENVTIPRSVRLVGSVCGEFPVDAYSPIFLEIAKEHKREDLSGRFNCSGSYAGQVLYSNFWHPVRSIPLPLFENDPDLTMQEFRNGYSHLLEEWDDSCIPDNLPCAAVSLKTHGNYCDEREAQRVVMLLVYSNAIARLMFLDFFEGAMDDCISPEWYLSVSKLMPVDVAIQRVSEISYNQPEWQRVCSSISIKPNFLGNILVQGRKIETDERKWGFEWIYQAQTDLIPDLNNLLDELRSFFVR